jgi:hemerythrin-like metal-binding protein
MEERQARDLGGPFMEWSGKYSVGIEAIDRQHAKLFGLINLLQDACLRGRADMDATFREAMRRMVEYVAFHFDHEMQMLRKIGYPGAASHKKEHDGLVRDIIVAVRKYEKGDQLIPCRMVRTLREWVLSHIAIHDKTYAAYIANLRKKGLLCDL